MMDVEIDTAAVVSALGQFGDQAPAATFRALNRIATTARARAAREVSKDLKVKVGTARGAMRIFRASQSRLESQVISKGSRLPLIGFTPRQINAGVSYNLGRGRSTVRSGFIESMPTTGHRGVFVRQGPKVVMTKGRYAGQRRQRIYERFGPSIPRVFANDRVQQITREVIAERWEIEIGRQINAILTRSVRGRRGT